MNEGEIGIMHAKDYRSNTSFDSAPQTGTLVVDPEGKNVIHRTTMIGRIEVPCASALIENLSSEKFPGGAHTKLDNCCRWLTRRAALVENVRLT